MVRDCFNVHRVFWLLSLASVVVLSVGQPAVPQDDNSGFGNFSLPDLSLGPSNPEIYNPFQDPNNQQYFQHPLFTSGLIQQITLSETSIDLAFAIPLSFAPDLEGQVNAWATRHRKIIQSHITYFEIDPATGMPRGEVTDELVERAIQEYTAFENALGELSTALMDTVDARTDRCNDRQVVPEGGVALLCHYGGEEEDQRAVPLVGAGAVVINSTYLRPFDAELLNTEIKSLIAQVYQDGTWVESKFLTFEDQMRIELIYEEAQSQERLTVDLIVYDGQDIDVDLQKDPSDGKRFVSEPFTLHAELYLGDPQ